MLCNNPKLDLVNLNAYIKFGEIDLVNINAYIKFGGKLSSSSQDIERKRNFDVNTLTQIWEK